MSLSFLGLEDLYKINAIPTLVLSFQSLKILFNRVVILFFFYIEGQLEVLNDLIDI